MQNKHTICDRVNTVKDVLNCAVDLLRPLITTSRLDAELMLSHVLGKSRAWLLTWPDYCLSVDNKDSFDALLKRRLKGEPIAYLFGKQEFWGMSLKVTPDTLIPRADTECLVEYVLKNSNTFKQDKILNVADLGTGSGAISLALAKECPNWKMIATDKEQAALMVAQHNAKVHQLHTNIKFLCGDWCEPLGHQLCDVIISNPPYIAHDDPCWQQANLSFEPKSALLAQQQGLSDLQRLIESCPNYLKRNGWLLLEHGSSQGEPVRSIFESNRWQSIKTHYDYAGLPRFTVATI